MTSIPTRARSAQVPPASTASALDLATALRWLGLDASAAEAALAPGASAPGQPVASPALATLIAPPAACPGCFAQRSRPWPGATTTSRFCARCRARFASRGVLLSLSKGAPNE